MPSLPQRDAVGMRRSVGLKLYDMRRKKNTSNGQRNRPIVSLIKWYSDKKSGKVSDARQEIQRRFEGLDWRHQKQIMSLFLEASATDRRWAIKKLYYHWDASFESQIAEMWDKCNDFEYVCTVNHCMPMDFILQHLDRLDGGSMDDRSNYFYICQRFAGCEGFTVDKDKLSALDFLTLIYYKQFKSLDDDEALDLLFEITYHCCLFWTDYETRLAYEGEDFVTPSQFMPIAKALYYLRGLGCYRAVNTFVEWNARVRDDIAMSDEHAFVMNYIHSDKCPTGYTEHDFHVSFKYAYLQLDEKYKKSSDPSIEDILECIHLGFFMPVSAKRQRLIFKMEHLRPQQIAEVINKPSKRQEQVRDKVERAFGVPMDVVKTNIIRKKL